MAVQLILQSNDSGNYAEDHQQWDTIRKLRTAYSNQVRASAEANRNALAVGDMEGKSSQRISADPCAALWFQRFMAGCKRRMGQDWRPDRAISHQLMKALLAKVDEGMRTSKGSEERKRWIFAGCYFAICYVVSLQGPEGLLLDLEGLRKNFIKGQEEGCVFIAGP